MPDPRTQFKKVIEAYRNLGQPTLPAETTTAKTKEKEKPSGPTSERQKPTPK